MLADGQEEGNAAPIGRENSNFDFATSLYPSVETSCFWRTEIFTGSQRASSKPSSDYQIPWFWWAQWVWIRSRQRSVSFEIHSRLSVRGRNKNMFGNLLPARKYGQCWHPRPGGKALSFLLCRTEATMGLGKPDVDVVVHSRACGSHPSPFLKKEF